MRHWIVCAAVLLIATPSSFAEAQASPTRVLVAPLAEVNEQQQPDWISRAIQQSVADELAALSDIEVAPNSPAVAVAPTTAQAKALGIKYVVRGTIQRLNGEIRVTGRVEDVETGKTAGGFKATGPQHQLFAIEDSLGRQLKRIVAPMQADPGGLEEPRPIATGPARGGAGGAGGAAGTGVQTPIQPIRGVYEGSDLQRAIEDRDYLRRTQRRIPDDYSYTPPQTYPPPTYPGGYGYGYGYGYGSGWPGWGHPWGGGWGWNGGGDTNVIIVPGGGNGGSGGGNGGGGSVVRPHLPTIQTQRLRNAAVNPGQSGNFIGPAPARAPHPGTIKK
jgi:TolB-like protein